MRHIWKLVLVLALVAGLAVVPGCRKQMVTVQTGEVVICTQGEIVSDTTEEIEVPVDQVADHGVTTEVITCDLHTKLAALYAEALDAIAEGDLEAAERALAEIAASDGAYRDTGTLLADVRAKTGSTAGATTPPASTPGSGGQTGGQTPGATPPGDDTGLPVGPIANLVNYIPDRLPGFVGQRIYSDPFALFRDYLPESSGKMGRLAVEVEQFQDAEMVKRRVDERVRTYYSVNGQNVKVGTKDAYFGTRDGLAVVAVPDGAILVLIEVSTSSSNPAEHRDALIAVARASTGQ